MITHCEDRVVTSPANKMTICWCCYEQKQLQGRKYWKVGTWIFLCWYNLFRDTFSSQLPIREAQCININLTGFNSRPRASIFSFHCPALRSYQNTFFNFMHLKFTFRTRSNFCPLRPLDHLPFCFWFCFTDWKLGTRHFLYWSPIELVFGRKQLECV